MVSQSGVQSIYGGGSIDPQFTNRDEKSGEKSKEGPGMAIFIGLAFVLVAVGLIISVLIFRGSAIDPKVLPTLSTVALLAIALQMMIGFPLEKSIQEQMNDSSVGDSIASVNEMGAMFAQLNIGVVYRPWIYFEMAFLAFPLAFAFFGMQPKKPAMEDEPEIQLP